MLSDPTEPLSTADVRSSTLAFGLLACMLSIPLVLLQAQVVFSRSWITLVAASAVFWGIVSMLASKYFWGSYYVYIYPPWLRRLFPLNLVLYSLIALVMWFFVKQLGFNVVISFLILGGLEGILEHIIGIYGLDILEKVPWLVGLDPLPILAFSFVEYVFYWSLVIWLVLAFQAII